MAGGDPIWDEARRALPLPDLMRHLGDGGFLPAKHGGESKAPRCPFCEAEGGKWIVKQREDGSFSFHCFKTSCVAHSPEAGNSEIGYLALRRNLSSKDACREFLDMALPNRKQEREEREKLRKPEQREGPEPNPARNLRGGPWHELWKKLGLNRGDIEAALKKRGLTHETLEIFGVRSNVAGNAPLVMALEHEFNEVDLLELGIWKEQDNGQVTPAGQLTGWGRTGEFHCKPCDSNFRGKRCPKCDRKARREDAVWSPKMEPPIFPYFGDDGSAIYLRPHKGGVRNRELKLLQQLEIPDEEDEDFECASHVFVPPNFGELLAASDGTAVFTEGEWKVMALAQCGIPALACPGITFIRNAAFREELIGILRLYRVRNLVIIFDNEDKGNPAFPGYQPDPRKQHDAQLYAEYTQTELAPVLRGMGGTVRVGRLPDHWPAKAEPQNIEWDKWRDGAGKADFDGILGTFAAKHGVEHGTKLARKCFRQCIERATLNPAKDSELFPFPGSIRRILDRRLYLLSNRKEKLASGGDAERDLAKAFSLWDSKGVFSPDPAPEGAKPSPRMVDKMMADAFAEVVGCFYVRKDMFGKNSKAREKTEDALQEVSGKIFAVKGGMKHLPPDDKKARRAELKLLNAYERSLKERLRGKPVAISECIIKGAFRLRLPGGSTVRLVQIFDRRNPKRESPNFRLSAEQCASPQELRKYLLDIGRGTWGGPGSGQDAVDRLNAMLDDDVYLCDIHSVSHVGAHEDTGIWFYGDGAFARDRTKPDRLVEIRPDSQGVFWNPVDGQGYLIDANNDESSMSSFALGLPKLFSAHKGEDEDHYSLFDEGNIGDRLEDFIAATFHAPETKPLRELLQRMREGEVTPSIEGLLAGATNERIPLPDLTRNDPVTGKPVMTEMTQREAMDTELARLTWQQMRDDFYQTVGDRDAWLAMGTMSAYGYGPELVQNYLCHPGIFFTGDYQTGKTETARRMVGIWGQNRQKFIDLSDTSQTALVRTLAQYSSIPVCLDEYRQTNASDPRQKMIDGMLRAATQRGESHKGTIASTTSTVSTPPRTSPIVTGQNSPRDSATASRYAHLTMAHPRRREKSAEAWSRLKAWCPHYYHLGRWLISRRPLFAKRAMEAVRAWLGSADVKSAFGDQERIKLVYGVAFATFNTVSEMLGLPLAQEDADSFRNYAIAYGARSMSHVKDETFRNRFWNEVINALGRNTGIRPKFFGQKFVTMTNPDGTPISKEFPLTTELLRNALMNERVKTTIRVTNLLKHDHPVPVVYIAIKQLYEEWLRDLASRHETCPISFANLRGEIEKERYFIPRPTHLVAADGEEDHRQRFKLEDEGQGDTMSKPWSCWCISLGREINEDGSEGDYIFPFARKLIDALSGTVSEAEAEREEKAGL